MDGCGISMFDRLVTKIGQPHNGLWQHGGGNMYHWRIVGICPDDLQNISYLCSKVSKGNHAKMTLFQVVALLTLPHIRDCFVVG